MTPAAATAKPAYDVFASYNWRDAAAVSAVAEHLRGAGLKPFLDRWYLIPGQPWQPALERALNGCAAVAVFVGPGEMGRWQQREMQLALDRRGLPVIPVLLPGADPALGFLGLNTWVDLRESLEDPVRLAALACAIRGEPPGPDMARAASTICPFRGLLYFREEDAPFFFGRDEYAERLAETVERQGFTALVAASGAGKSSLVRAGLIPRLRRSRAFAWDVMTMFPTDRPLRALANALLPLLEPEMTEVDRLGEAGKLAGQFARRECGLRDVAESILARQPGTERLLLVVDQWEELYTLAAAEDRQCFIDHILEAGPLVHVVATLRGDFAGRALEYRPLSDRMQGAQFNLGPMTREELESAITGPAARTGLTLEDGLTTRLLDDAAAEPANLPLLEFVLRRLWEERDGPELSHAVHDDIGGLRGALARHADAVYGRLPPLEQQTARKIFLQVVRPAGDGGYTRRRASLDEVGEPAWDLVQKLARERLLVTARVAAEPETVEVCHEALIGHWGEFRTWLAGAQEFLLWLDRFRALFEDWQRHDRDPERLLHGPACAEAQGWLARDAESLSAEQREFVALSVRRRDEQVVRDLRLAQERIEEQRRAARRLKWALAAVAAGLVVAGGFYLEGRRQRSTAVSARNQAEQLIEFLVFNLLDKLAPVGRLDLMDEVVRQVDAYYESLGDVDSGGSAEVQRRRSAAMANRGDVLVAQGKLDAAFGAYRSSRAIAERLAQQDSSNSEWQRDLSSSHEKVGNVLVAQGKLDAALSAYQSSRAIAERLTQQDPSNTGWQHYLSISHEKVSDVLAMQGRLDAALSAYQSSSVIRERLAQQDPSNLEWQRDLSISHEKLGIVLVAQGKLGAALTAYQFSRDIRERLAQQDPNTQWQRDLAVSDMNIGSTLAKQRKPQAALAMYLAALEISDRLAAQDPTNALWRADLVWLRGEIERVRKMGAAKK